MVKAPVVLDSGLSRLATLTTTPGHDLYHIPTYLLCLELPLGVEKPSTNLFLADTRDSFRLSLIGLLNVMVSPAEQNEIEVKKNKNVYMVQNEM